MIITYTNPKSAASAIQGFSASNWNIESQQQNIHMVLNYFHSKENKIYAAGLK